MIKNNLKKVLNVENTLSRQDLEEFVMGIKNLGQADELNRVHLDN